MALRAVWGAVLYCSTSSLSDGSLSPAASRLASIAARRSSAICRDGDLGSVGSMLMGHILTSVERY